MATLQVALGIYAFIFTNAADGYCPFPTEWRGNWFGSRDGDVIITSSSFSTKGTCTERKHDFFLAENREIGCYTCLLMRLRHVNLLQYQESYCVGRDSLQRICSTVRSENIQYTLIRVSGQLTRCPFTSAYHFVYSNNSGGQCRNPASYVQPCAVTSRLRFHFRHCPDAAYTYDHDMDFSCLATWQDSRRRQLVVGRVTAQGVSDDKNNLYRCIMYSVVGTVVYAVMSVDASCRGLRSPRDGPLAMEFTQDVFGWPMPRCTFPSWLARTSLRDLSGNHVYRSGGHRADGDVINMAFRQSPGHQLQVIKTYRCHVIVGQNTTAYKMVAIAFVSYGCSARFQCVRFVRHRNVVEFHEAEGASSRVCPLEGRYEAVRPSDRTMNCHRYLDIGCNVSSVIELVDTCSAQTEFRLECLRTWKINETRYLIARKIGDSSALANCFALEMTDTTLYFSVDSSCNSGTAPVLTGSHAYVVNRRQRGCGASRRIKHTNTEVQIWGENRHSYYEDDGGSYRHVDDVTMTSRVTSPLSTNSNACLRAGFSSSLLLACFLHGARYVQQ